MDSEKSGAKARFTAELKGLNCNSKPIITSLTRLADEYIRFAPMIVECVENHLSQTKPELKIAVLYLIDSIVKNIKRDYVSLFSKNIVSNFTKTFDQLAKLNQVSKMKMLKLRNTWKDIFPDNKLYNIDCICKLTDPSWTVTPTPLVSRHNHAKRTSSKAPSSSTTTAHYGITNTSPFPPPLATSTMSFTTRPSSQNVNGVTELQEEVLIKQKQLLELQTQKLKLEVLQAQVQLEEKTREKSDFDSTYLTQVLLQQAETARQKTQIATSLLSGVVVPTYNIPPNNPILTTNVQMAPTTTTAVPHEEIILGDSPTPPPEATTIIPSFSKHFSEPSHIQIEKNFKGETFTEVPLPVSTKHDKPYYNGYDPSNIYDKTPDSGSVVAIRKSSSARLSSLNKSLSPDTNKRKYNLKETHDEDARGGESQASFPHIQLISKDVDNFNVCTNFEESFDRPARKEKNIIKTNKVIISALKRPSATTFSTHQNSSSSELQRYKKPDDDTQASITIIDLDHDHPSQSFGVHEGDSLLDVSIGTVNVNPVEFAPTKADPHTSITSSSDYPPMKKLRKSQKQGEGFSPIHDLFGGEDVDLRPRQSSSAVQPSLSSSISTATILDGQKQQQHHNKQQQFSNIPLAENYDCPVPPTDVDLTANVKNIKKGIAYEVIDVKSQETLPSTSTAHLRDSDHRLLLINKNTPNPSKEFIGIHLDQQQQNDGRPPSLMSISLQDEKRQNQSWNQNQSYPMIKPTTGHQGILSNQHNNGINMSGASTGTVPGHGPAPAPVTGVGSLLINPWVESKGGNVWNTLGPADSPYGHGGGPSNRFPVAGWNQNQNQTQAISSGSGVPLSTNAWLPCPQPVGPNPFEEALSQPQIQIPSRGFPDFFIPPVNMAEYEIVAKDTSGTVPIDGVLRKVRFYGETAVVVQGVNGDEPREISFRSEEPRNVYIDNEREPVVCFIGKSSSVFLNRKQHFIKLGAPTREIYIDGDHYEASFGGDPIFVRSDSGMHSIKLGGPPPKVLVGQTLRNDLVAGRLNLFLDGHRVDIYLDEKPQAYELPGDDYPLILRFCDGFNTLKINGRPFPTSFGGPPVTITVPGGSRHQINISALNDSTRITMSRYLQSQTSQEHSQTNHKIQKHLPLPLIPCNSTDKDTAFELDSNVPMSERVTPPLILPDKDDTNPTITTSDVVYPSHDSTKNPSVTETGSSQTEADARNNITTSSMTDPGPRFSLGGNVNVHDLLLKLKVAGLLPTTTTATSTTLVADGPYKTVSANPEIVARESQTEKTETLTLKSTNNSTKCDDVSVRKAKKCSLQHQRFSGGKTHKKNVMKQEIKIAPLSVVDLDFTQLKYRIPSIIAQIWTGTQCSSCGLRFHPDQSQKFSEHLDWHFRHNRRIKARGKTICRRQFYYKMSDWMQYSQFEELEERARSMFEVEADELARNEKKENEGNVSWMNPDLHTTPCSGNEGTLCPQCGEGFETYFDEDKEEWRFKEACLSYDGEEENHIRRIYHILCYKDLLASLEGKSLLSYVVTASNEIESQQLQPAALTSKDDPDEIVILKEGKKEVEVMDVVDIDVEGDSRKVPVSHRPSSAKTKAADAITSLGDMGEVDDVMEIVKGESQVPVTVTVSSSSSLEAMDVSDNVSPEPKSLSQNVVGKAEEGILSITNVDSHEAEGITISNSKIITSSNQVVVSKVNDNVQSDKVEMGSGSEAAGKQATPCVILNDEPGQKLSTTSDSNLIQEAEIKSIGKENAGILETCVSETEHANPNVSDSASTNLPMEICQPAIVNEQTVAMSKTQEASVNPVSASEGNISIVKIDLTDDDDDVVEVSSSPSTSHILSTIEGNIPLNGHTPLINKVVSSTSIRIRIQDALLNEDRSRTLKSTGGSLSLAVSGDIITLGDDKEDENSSKCLEGGQVERSKNTGVESCSTKPKTSNNSHVPIVCTKGTDDVDVFEEPVINTRDEYLKTSDSSRIKSKSFPRTNFTDCPVTISGKEISGLCVIS